MIKEVNTGYFPRPHQAFLHTNLRRFNVVICHRRFGKTHFSLNEMLDKGLRHTLKNPQYAYIAPTYGQAKRVAWDLLKDYVKNIPGVTINEADLRIDIARPHLGDKVRFMLLGAENPGTLKGLYLDGVVLDEYAEMNPEIWSIVIRPALSDRLGWAIFIGTPKGENHLHAIYAQAQGKEDWFTQVFRASETGIIPLSELEAARAVMSEPEYLQEYECSFSAALVGAYYGREMEEAEQSNRICGVPHDPAVPVFTGWDLGVDDSTVIWFAQRVGRETRIIDYHEESGKGLDYFVKLMKDKNYNYEEHFLPHDVAQRELSTGKSRLETLQKMGLKRVRVVPRLDIADGINAARLLIKKCYFDKDRCAFGIKALKSYERAWDAKMGVFQSRPKHNWASHGADGFRYLAIGLDESRIDNKDRAKPQRQAHSDFKIV